MKKLIIPILIVIMMVSSSTALIPLQPIFGGDMDFTGVAREYGPDYILTDDTWTPEGGIAYERQFGPELGREYEVGGKTCSFTPDRQSDYYADKYVNYCIVNSLNYGIAYQGFRISGVDGSWTNLCLIDYSNDQCYDKYHLVLQPGEKKCWALTDGFDYHFNGYYCNIGGEKECVDTDGGTDYKNFGRVTVTIDGKTNSFNDICSNDYEILERGCTPDKSVGSLSKDCRDYGNTWVCDKGECVDKGPIQEEQKCNPDYEDAKCIGAAVYYYDKDCTGNTGDVKEYCAADETCYNKECVSTDMYDERVKEGSITPECYTCSGDVARQSLLEPPQPTLWELLFGTSTGRAGEDFCEAQNTNKNPDDWLYSLQPTCADGFPRPNPDYFKPEVKEFFLQDSEGVWRQFSPDTSVNPDFTKDWKSGENIPVIVRISNAGANEFYPEKEAARLRAEYGDGMFNSMLSWYNVGVEDASNLIGRWVTNAKGLGEVWAMAADIPGLGSYQEVEDLRIKADTKARIDAIPYLNFGFVELAFYENTVAENVYSYPRFSSLSREAAFEFEETIRTVASCQQTSDGRAESDQRWITSYTVLFLPKVNGACWTASQSMTKEDSGYKFGGACEMFIATMLKIPNKKDTIASGTSNWDEEGKYVLHAAAFENCWQPGIPQDSYIDKGGLLIQIGHPEEEEQYTSYEDVCCEYTVFGLNKKEFLSSIECSNKGGKILPDIECGCPKDEWGDFICDKDDLDHVYRLKTTGVEEKGYCVVKPFVIEVCADNQVCGLKDDGQADCLADIDKNNIPDITEPNKEVCCDIKYDGKDPDWLPLSECKGTWGVEIKPGQCDFRTDSFCGDGDCSSTESCSSCPADCGECDSVCGDGICTPEEKIDCKCPADCGCQPVTCNNNNKCEPELGETSKCSDCVYICGDGVCDPGETQATCYEDCGGSQVCNNNGKCEPELGETAANCISDCNLCADLTCCKTGIIFNDYHWETGATCSDGKAVYGEDRYNCPSDCKVKQCNKDEDCAEGEECSDEGFCEKEYESGETYTDGNNFCYKGRTDTKCWPRHQNIDLYGKDIQDIEDLGNLERITKSWLDDAENPLCLNKFGDDMCQEGGECLEAKEEENSRNKEKNKVYELIEDAVFNGYNSVFDGYLNLATLGLKPLIERGIGYSNEERIVEQFGLCVYEERGVMDIFSRWIQDNFNVDEDTAVYIMWAMIIGVILIFVYLLRPKPPASIVLGSPPR